ncbi:MAG: tRNA (N6-threonylcarbamoyladenosine(37)-N6)-methyltransferase TrmO [Desulfobacterales bacterium]|nr:tRNA (N6-threonylcarbamoyladenosine(37)-N6)-methyltransferase TrmO [Desulfobacterales bacterium]
MTDSYKIFPVGFVRKKGQTTQIEIQKKFEAALLGLDGFSHIYVIYWFHENDTPRQRSVLQVHPRKDKRNPLTGVFATHSPIRPNLVALTTCRIVAIRENMIEIDRIDAIDGTPVIDIKSYNSKNEAAPPFRVPEWIRIGDEPC